MILSNSTFQELGLEKVVQQCLEHFNYKQPSLIQQMSIPPGLQGQDLIVQAHAGTGKTLCFLTNLINIGLKSILMDEYHKQLKILQQQDENIIQNIQTISPYTLIIVPTRELAIQITDIMTRFSVYLVKLYNDNVLLTKDIKNKKLFFELLQEVLQPKLFIGGLPVEQDRDVLKLKRCSVIIGTLGRIMQLIQENSMSLHNIKLVILDEADKLFENSQFQPNFKKIMTAICGKNNENNKPQILTYSATYPQKPLNLIKLFMKKSQFISTVQTQVDEELEQGEVAQTDPSQLSLPNLDQYYTILEKNDLNSKYQIKLQFVVTLLKKIEFKQTILFYNDKNRGENLFNDLRAEGFKPVFIHGDQTQSDRIKVMHQMRRNKVNLIISTDLVKYLNIQIFKLSRGIDVDTLDLVIHFDTPNQIETYFHRIGRTGRFGSFGASFLLLDGRENLDQFIWTQEWEDTLVSHLNDQFKGKHIEKDHQQIDQDTDKKQQQEFFSEFLNGVSSWRDKNYKFYDESKFKYKIEIKQPNEKKEMVIFQRRNDTKQINKLDQLVNKEIIDKTQQYQVETKLQKHESLVEILKCQKCREFMKEIEKFQSKKLKLSLITL